MGLPGWQDRNYPNPKPPVFYGHGVPQLEIVFNYPLFIIIINYCSNNYKSHAGEKEKKKKDADRHFAKETTKIENKSHFYILIASSPNSGRRNSPVGFTKKERHGSRNSWDILKTENNEITEHFLDLFRLNQRQSIFDLRRTRSFKVPDRTGSEVQKDPCSHANTNSYIISKAGLTKAEEELDDQELLRGLRY